MKCVPLSVTPKSKVSYSHTCTGASSLELARGARDDARDDVPRLVVDARARVTRIARAQVDMMVVDK